MARRDRRRRRDYSAQATTEALTASGAMVTAGVTSNSRQSSWQEEAWAYYHAVPELHYAANFYGDLLARASLVIEVRLPDGKWGPGADEVGNPIGLAAGLAQSALDDLGSHDRLLRSIGISDMVPGESYLVGVIGQPGWRLYTTRELRYTGTDWQFKSSTGTGGEELAEEQSVARIWRPDPSMPEYAISPVRALLDTLAQICAMTDAITAAGLSRALSGIFRFPEEIQSPAPIGQAEGTDDGHPLQQQLVDVASAAIGEPRSASRFVPLVIPVPSDIPSHALGLVPLTHGLDGLPAGDMLEAAVNRFARGMPLPVETVLGLQRTTFANGDSIARALKHDYLEPALERICDDLTSGYLIPALVDTGADVTTVRIGFTSEDIHSPDVSAQAAAASTLVKAGWDPAQVLETVGLPPMDHTGVVTADPVPVGVGP